jgi:hypothetical protein
LYEDQRGHGKEERGRERGKFTDELHTEIILMLLIARILATFINQRINDPRDRKAGRPDAPAKKKSWTHQHK